MQWQVSKLGDAASTDVWQDWQRLVEKHHANNPMLGSVFVKGVVKFFGDELYLAKGFHNEELSSMLLLQKSGPYIWKGFKPSQAQVALLLLDPKIPPHLDDLVRQIPGFCLRLDLFSLDPYEHQGLIDSIASRNKSKYAVNIQISTEEDFEKYWSERPKNLRKNINRYQNRLTREAGEFSISCVEQQGDILAATDRYGMLEVQGWKGRGGTALHPSNMQGQFYRDIMDELAEKGRAVVYEMQVDNKLVASRLCIFSDSMFVILKTTFDESFKKFAVGRMLLKHVIEDVFTRKLSTNIDFYTNASSEQLDWSTHQRDMENLSVYHNILVESLVQGVLAVKNVLRKVLSR